MTYPETLKAISIHAPHAYAICKGIKKREYRSRATKQRGWVLIHASKSKASDKFFKEYGIDKNTVKRGAIIGAAYLSSCRWSETDNAYSYRLREPILFDEPIEDIKGCQAIFWGAKTPSKQAAFEKAWNYIQSGTQPKDILPKSETQELPEDSNTNTEVEQKAENVITESELQEAIEADTEKKPIEIPGFELEIIDNPDEPECTGYKIFDSLTKEFLFQIYENFNGWENDFTRQTYETPHEAISIAREKAIERIERSVSLEIKPIKMKEADGYGNAFIVRNRENSTHYVVRPSHPDPHARCECADTLYRGVECKHQLAVKESFESTPSWKKQAAQTLERLLDGEELIIDIDTGEAILKYESDTRFGVNYLCTRRGDTSTKLIMSEKELEKYTSDLYNPRVIEAFGSANPRFTTNNQYPITDIQFVSPDGFYNWEAIAEGETIATINYDSEHLTQPYYIAVDSVIIHRTNTQSKAENYIRWHYKNKSLPIIEKEPTEQCSIEDCKFIEERGQQYNFRINNKMIGYIWLSNDGDWVNSIGDKYDDWRDCGLALAKLIRNDLYEMVAA